VTTPHSSRAGGFLNDMAVSSHGDSSVQPHERAVAQKQLMNRLAQQTLARSCFYPGERFSLEPANTIKLSVCERTTELFFSPCEKAVGIPPPVGGATLIPRALCPGLTLRFGKFHLSNKKSSQPNSGVWLRAFYYTTIPNPLITI
jgi:hypothetical protein